MSLKENDACIMIEEKDLNSEILVDSINKCLDVDFKMNLKKNMSKLSVDDSTIKIYEILKNIIK